MNNPVYWFTFWLFKAWTLKVFLHFLSILEVTFHVASQPRLTVTPRSPGPHFSHELLKRISTDKLQADSLNKIIIFLTTKFLGRVHNNLFFKGKKYFHNFFFLTIFCIRSILLCAPKGLNVGLCVCSIYRLISCLKDLLLPSQSLADQWDHELESEDQS